MNRVDRFKVGDVITPTKTIKGIPKNAEVIVAGCDGDGLPYAEWTGSDGRKYGSHINDKYYELSIIYNSPLYKALR